MFRKLSLEAFADAAASQEPVPGGGSVSALAGGLAASLAAMVAALTLRKKAYSDRAPEMQRLYDTAARLQAELLDAVDRDAQSYREVLSAYRLVRSTEEERRERAAAVQLALRHATEVPMQVAETAFQVLELAGTVALRGNPDMRTDAGVGVLLARSAALGALMNVRINLDGLRDRDFVSQMKERIEKIRQNVIRMESDFLDSMGL